MPIIYKSGDISEAHIIAGLLNSHGIQAHVDGLYLQGGVGDLAVNDFVNVKVPEQDVEQAMQIIAEYDNKKIDSVEDEAYIAKKPVRLAKFLLFLAIAMILFLLVFFISG